jgi:dihydrofolate reductase
MRPATPLPYSWTQPSTGRTWRASNGRTSSCSGGSPFDRFSSYWPFVADAPAPADPSAREARAVDQVNRAISRRYNELPKVVVSDRGPVPPDNAWHASTTVVSRADVAEWLATNTREGSGDVLVFGSSHVLWNALLAAGLVDELHLMLSPIALVTGVPLS